MQYFASRLIDEYSLHCRLQFDQMLKQYHPHLVLPRYVHAQADGDDLIGQDVAN